MEGTGMFARLKVKLKNDANFGVEISSLLHGVIMEHIPCGYADQLHNEGLKPYSQHIEKDEDNLIWYITTMTEEAKERIIDSIMNVESFMLNYKNCEMKVISKKLSVISYENLLESTYFGSCSRKVRVEFVTPTAFKVNGRYQFYPTEEHLLKSLIAKHDTLGGKTELYTDELIDNIRENVHITGYRLRSVRFPLEGVNISSFAGSITLTIGGPQQFVNLINMLLVMGEYSGVGIKTGLGMGGIKVQQMHRKEK